MRNLILFLFVCLLGITASYADDESIDEAVAKAKSSFDKLPPPGKFASGLAVGYISSRVVVGSAATAAKVAGASYVVSEALHFSGALNELPEVSAAVMGKVKNNALKFAKGIRKKVRASFKPESVQAAIQTAVQKERLATIGFATGAFAGFAL